MTPPDWRKPELRDGMRRMLQLRAARLDAGERPIGWKLGFGAPISLQKFGLSGPLVGFLTDAGLHRPGAVVSVEGWSHPVAEPELAVHLGEDVPPGSVDIGRAIAGITTAIELADVHPPPQDIEDVLGANIYHRAVITDIRDAKDVDMEGLTGRIISGGEPVTDVGDLEGLTGGLHRIIAHCADLLGAAGERLRAGDFVIAGSVIPPVRLQPGIEFEFEVDGLAGVSVLV